MVVYDFLTGNSERLVNTLSASADVWRAKKDRKAQGITLAGCRKSDCHVENAWRVSSTSPLVLVDNNSAFYYDRAMIEV